MAGLLLRAPSGAVALTASTAKTALQLIAAAQQRVKVNYVNIAFDGVSPTDQPVTYQIRKQTTAIGGSPGTVTLVKKNAGDDETIQTTGAVSAGGTEPTGSDVYETGYIHPQAAKIIPGPFWIKGGERLGVVLTAAASVNVTVTADIEE